MLNYDDDDYSQGQVLNKETFKALTKHDILQPYISENDFRSSNNISEIGYNFYVFVMGYLKNLESAQTIKVEFIFSKKIPAGLYAYALKLTKNLVSISSDGQRHINLVEV